MVRSSEQLRDDALRIWRSGLRAVAPWRLIFEHVRVDGGALWLGDHELPLMDIGRIAVVGAGKASAGMAWALEQALGPKLLAEKQLDGWVNVPADCVVPTDRIKLHAGRAPGVNEPTEAAAAGVRQMLHLVGALDPHDLCICLISGGGSALMPAPVEGFSLQDKVVITRELSACGATIEQLNAVRSELSMVKGGRLAKACGAGRLVSLILSDVPGDDLNTIASGPTVERQAAPEAAIAVLRSLGLEKLAAAQRAITVLEKGPPRPRVYRRKDHDAQPPRGCRVTNIIIGNNATAVDAAGVEAERLGYSHAMVSANSPEGPAEEVAARLLLAAQVMRDAPGPDCLISGGEPTVHLAPEGVRGRGGRNQQLCLAALTGLDDWSRLSLVSGGTDGEDGPTDAAGALVDAEIAAQAKRLNLDASAYLERNDAYSFFEQVGGLLKTGPTHTNVGDLRVVTTSR